MKFPKLKLSGLVKAPSGLLPEEKQLKSVEPLKSPNSKFAGLKRELAKEKNITKKYKI